METVNLHHAKTHFSKLLLRVNAGEEINIAKSGKPFAKLVPPEPVSRPTPGIVDGSVSPDYRSEEGQEKRNMRMQLYRCVEFHEDKPKCSSKFVIAFQRGLSSLYSLTTISCLDLPLSPITSIS
jgi:prevent-host-death family protein